MSPGARNWHPELDLAEEVEALRRGEAIDTVACWSRLDEEGGFTPWGIWLRARIGALLYPTRVMAIERVRTCWLAGRVGTSTDGRETWAAAPCEASGPPALYVVANDPELQPGQVVRVASWGDAPVGLVVGVEPGREAPILDALAWLATEMGSGGPDAEERRPTAATALRALLLATGGGGRSRA